MFDATIRALLHLSCIDGVGPVTIHRLLSASQVSIADIYACSVQDFILCGVSKVRALRIVNALRDRTVLERELHMIERHGVTLVTCVDDTYPEVLRMIHTPPPLLYVWGGSFECDVKRVAVVGSRLGGAYAREALDAFIPELVAHGCTIVSGGARGVDAMAHEKALACSGKTIVVLGSGLLEPYPREHRRLFDRVRSSGGMVVSPFSLNQQPTAGNFPSRNRIIAGLSQACFVVRAARRSGGLITARFALEEGREVFALPGSFSDPLSEGCHDLISQGAYCATSADDILREIGGGRKCNVHVAGRAKNELEVLLTAPCSIDDLSRSLKRDGASIREELFALSLDGRVRQNGAGLWELV